MNDHSTSVLQGESVITVVSETGTGVVDHIYVRTKTKRIQKDFLHRSNLIRYQIETFGPLRTERSVWYQNGQGQKTRLWSVELDSNKKMLRCGFGSPETNNAEDLKLVSEAPTMDVEKLISPIACPVNAKSTGVIKTIVGDILKSFKHEGERYFTCTDRLGISSIREKAKNEFYDSLRSPSPNELIQCEAQDSPDEELGSFSLVEEKSSSSSLFHKQIKLFTGRQGNTAVSKNDLSITLFHEVMHMSGIEDEEAAESIAQCCAGDRAKPGSCDQAREAYFSSQMSKTRQVYLSRAVPGRVWSDYEKNLSQLDGGNKGTTSESGGGLKNQVQVILHYDQLSLTTADLLQDSISKAS